MIRLFRDEDARQVQLFWYEGFLDLPWSSTSHLAPISSPLESSFLNALPRPLLATAMAAGTILAIVSESAAAGLIAIVSGAMGLIALHIRALLNIDSYARSCIHSGDMRDIAKSWIIPGRSVFFVAEDAAGRTVGSVAVRAGGFDDSSKIPLKELKEPHTCTIWKMSTSPLARRGGFGRKLMNAAEDWVRQEGFKSIKLMTGNSVASSFYRSLGYTTTDGFLFHKNV